MKKTFLILIVPALFFVFTGCSKCNCIDYPLRDDETVPDENGFYESENEYEDDNDNETPDKENCLVLNEDWLVPDPEWKIWSYLRMIGEIADPEGEYVEATFADGKVKTTKETKDFEYGSYLSASGLVLAAQAIDYEFQNLDEEKGTATVDYYEGNWQFSKMMVPVLKEDGDFATDFGAFFYFLRTLVDVNFDINGAITDQRVRKKCWLAISRTEEYREDNKTFEVPVGGMAGCFQDNIDGSVGEALKMMFKNELTEKREDILKWINTQQDESVLEYGDDGFQFECVCYEENGIDEIPCWQYDGPGGAEECPPEVPEGECRVEELDDELSDEVLTDSDEVNDESNDESEIPDQE